MASQSLNPKLATLEGDPMALSDIASRIAAREPIWNVARFYGITQGQLLKWLTGDADRAAEYATALKACAHNVALEGLEKGAQADALLNRGLRVASSATEETLGVSKLEAGSCMKASAGKLGIGRFYVEVAGLLNPDAYGRRLQTTTMVVTASVDALLADRARGALAGVCRMLGEDAAPCSTEPTQAEWEKARVDELAEVETPKTEREPVWI